MCRILAASEEAMRLLGSLSAIVLCTVAFLGCGSGSDTPQPSPPTSVTKAVSPTGTTIVELPGGPTLQFDSGAVTTTTNVTIEVSAAAIPAEYGLQGRAYELKPPLSFPPGLVHATLPLVEVDGSVWLSSDDGFDALPVATVAGGKITADIPHFSIVFAGVLCTAEAACTPANPCHLGSRTCVGPPACTDLGSNADNGTACCGGGACTDGFCAAAAFEGSFKVTGILCNGSAPTGLLASWIAPPSIFRITQAGTTGHSIWTNGTCTVSQLHDVQGNFACSPSASGCASYSTSIFGVNLCGQSYDDTGTGPALDGPIPACVGGTVTMTEAVGTCSDFGGADPTVWTLTRE
jgi:hypothetical protein